MDDQGAPCPNIEFNIELDNENEYNMVIFGHNPIVVR